MSTKSTALKRVVAALPETPIDFDDMKKLEGADGVIGIAPYAAFGPVSQFVSGMGVTLDTGEVAGMAWDPETHEWSLVAYENDPADRRASTERMREEFEEWAGDLDRFESECERELERMAGE